MPPIPKKELRAIIKKKLAEMSTADRKKKSAAIQRKFLNSKYYKSATTILAYASFGTEVETERILHACLNDGKRLVLTRLNFEDKSMSLHEVKDLARDLTLNLYHIPEPRPDARRVSIDRVDTILVPGLAFSTSGERLGRGVGYYDRLLKRASKRAHRVALAFNCQVFDSRHFETELHDEKIGVLISELKTRSF